MPSLRTALRVHRAQDTGASAVKVREWNSLAEVFYGSRRRHLFGQKKRRVRLIHELEREIVRLEALAPNDGSEGAIKRLRKQLENVVADDGGPS